MANALYAKGKEASLEGSIAYLTDTINCALISGSYSPNTSTDQFYSACSADVIGTPQALSGKTGSGGQASASNVTFTAVASGSNINYVVIYKSTGTNSTSPLLALYDFSGSPVATNNGDITVSFSSGILYTI